MKHNPKSLFGGYTLIELMLVVAILGILASIAGPKFDLITQRSWQATTKGNLGAIRSTLSLYYSEHEGVWPMSGYPAGFPASGDALSVAVAPKYIKKIPTPKLVERVGSFNGFANTTYDQAAESHMNQNPPEDVVILYGTAGPTIGITRPFAYDPNTGLIYIANGNYDITGIQRFYEW